MSCPHCGAETTAGLLQCRVCRGALVPSGKQYALSALTPPADFDTTLPSVLSADDTTGLPPETTETTTGLPIGDDSVTGFGGAASSDETTQTGIAPDDRTTLPLSADDSQTRLEASHPATHHHLHRGAYGPLSPGETFGTRYDIIRLLGVGGMGAVYQAWDRELGVALALKVIKPPADGDAALARSLEQRFKHELLLARQVTHKSVVRIHDLGEIDGVKYITMSYVEGDDLATVLRHEGRLATRRVLKIARQVIAGLAAAHEAGVVHRDLKPANIMIEADDQALIMDFGIAQSTTGPRKERSGAVVGTVAYMSPQQATGQAVDQRSDVYSFGLILYDLLGGRPPSKGGESAMAELLARIGNAPESIRAINAEVPDAFDAVIMRCLQPSPDARFPSAADVAKALDRLDDDGVPIPVPKVRRGPTIAVAAVLTTALSIGGWWIGRGARAPVAHEPVSVLIADVQNTTGDSAFDNTFEQSLGIAIEQASFISAYSRKDARTVLAKLSPASAGRITTEASQLVAKSEGIKVVLAGSLARRGNGYTVGVNLIDPANGKVLRTVTADAPNRDGVLSAVGTVAAQVRSALGETKTEAAKLAGAETFTTASLGAMEAYSRGQDLNQRGRRQEALKAYEEAIAADPEFGRAYAGMGTIYFNQKLKEKTDDAFQKALEYLGRMTEREKLRTLGGYYMSVVRNYGKAIENYEELIKKYPADNIGYANAALAYAYLRKPDLAMSMGKKAVELYPRNILQRSNYAMYAMYAGQFATAVSEAEAVLKENPTYEYAFLTLARSKLGLGDRAGALNAYARLGQLATTNAVALQNMGEADLALSEGRFRDALRILGAGIDADRRANDTNNLAHKYVAAAEAGVAIGLRREAADYAQNAARISTNEAVLFPAALVLVQVGRTDAAQEIAAMLENQLQDQTRSFANLIDGQTALTHKRFGQAIDLFRDGSKRLDSWFSHFLLGRAYLEAGPAHAAEALGEFETCLKRRGEVTDAFVADMPTLRYLPPLYYWLARAQDVVVSASEAKKSFEAFLARRPSPDPADELAADARRRQR